MEAVMGVFTSEVISNCRRVFFPVLAAILLVLIPAVLFGQAYFGTVSGVLTDPTGAVIQGAKVTLLDLDKGYKFNAKSDSAGRYLFVSIPPGLYSVTAEMQGFEKTVRTRIRLNVTENATADLTLKIASATQSIDVKAQTQTIATEDAVTGEVIDRKFINDLPLIDRYVMDLTMLTPGVTEMDDQCGLNCTGTNFVSNGSRGATADILMDGASITNYEPNGGVTQATYTPSPEAVEEFKVQQSSFSAEFGFSGASIVNLVTRSGSNSFHGSGYDFIRNQITDANNWFANEQGQPIPPLRRNNYGGTIGGPIFKNKTFFFFDYDGTRATTMGTYSAGVPTDLERNNADFGEVCTAQGGSFVSGLCSVPQGQIYDPYSGVKDPSTGVVTRAAIPNNNIGAYISPGSPTPGFPSNLQPQPGTPGNLIDPIAQQMMKLFPEPTPNLVNSSIYYNWYGSGPNHGYNGQFDIKIDHRFSEKNLLSAKYSRDSNHGSSYNCFKNFTDPCESGPNPGTSHLFTLNDTHTISPTLLLTTTFGFTRGAERIEAYNPGNGVADPLGKLGFPSYLDANGFTGVPAMFIGGGYFSAPGWGLSTGTNPYGNYRQGQDTGQLTVVISKVHGAHEIKFGVDGRLHQQNYIQTNAPVGTFNFDQYGTAGCIPGDLSTCGGDAMASFMMGSMSSGGYEIQDRPATEDHQYSVFGQDNWKVNHKLTLNLGLRYDVSVPRTDRHNRQNWLDLNVASPLNGGSLSYTDQLTGQPVTVSLRGGEVFANSDHRSIVNMDWKDIQPRFGFAYQVTPQTVVRGGYGIYYDQPRSGATGVAPYGAQGFNQGTGIVTTYQSDGVTPYLHLSNPYPYGLIQPAGSSLGLMNDVGFAANGPLRNVTNTPYSQSWSFGFERQLPSNVLISAMYVGKKGTHLYYSGDNYINHLGPDIESLTADQVQSTLLASQIPNPFATIITDPNSPLSAATIPNYYLKLPYPQFPWGVTIEVPPIANSIYHSLQLTAEKRYSNGLQFLVTYVWAKSIDDASAQDDNTTWLGSFSSLVDPNKPWMERSLSTFDIPSVLQLSYTYDLPIGRGRAFLSNMPRVVEAIVGGWKTNGIWRVACGRPLTMFTADGTSLPTYGGQRPNIVGTPKRNYGGGHDVNWINNYFVDPTVFQLPDPYTFGNAPRAIGSVRTPLAFNTDMSVGKDFSMASLHEGMKLEFRLEAQNALNHPVFGTPDTSVDDPSFGQITYTSNSPREIQLALKLTF